ncbi:hypothetical protein ES332_A08G146500v1 [Gossypium tomentosum]|uniref:NAC domain-containing protein n=1 Tax=Gossypium tomentosum TaxID=34277 RepID=A0A5D2PJ15_GOSTO|nr:hypothetical protein ES332_A08G146500v1 [Gossypium tomentosum]
MSNIDDNSHIVGYRFHPTDKELVDHYLWNKILDRDSLVQAIKEVDSLFNKDPWELPGWSEIQSADQVWYFFSRRGDNKRVKRTTDKGFWKVTGKPRKVKGKKGCAAKKSLVFYEGRTPNAKWTPWVIHEYTFTSTLLDNREGIFLCKLKKKEDETANASSSESCQPSLVADEEIPDNSTMFNPDEMLDTLKERDREHELEMDEQQQPPDFTSYCDGLPHLSKEENDDESWIGYLVDDDEINPDELNLGNECRNFALVGTSVTCPGEPSRKRSRREAVVLCGAIENEECQPMLYEQAVSNSMMLDEHGGSKKHQALAMVNAPNVTSSSVKQDPHGRDRMVSLNNESGEMDIPDVESVVDPHGIVRATRFHNPYYKKLGEQEDDPKRINKRGKFCRKIAFQDEAIDVKQHATAVNLPIIMESTGKRKTAEHSYRYMRLQMHLNELADCDKKRFLHVHI